MKDLDFECFRIRYIERWIAAEYPNGLIRCPVHLSVGQEAVAVGVCAALNKDDLIVSTHRCHAHYLAKGGDLSAMLGELYGLRSGCCGGVGGSMHLMDPDAGVAWSGPIVGSAVPIAVGLAQAAKMDGSGRRVVCFMGDAAIEEGVVWESFNYATLNKLPITFIIENNETSVFADKRDRQLPMFMQMAGALGPYLHMPAAANEMKLCMLARFRSPSIPHFIRADCTRLSEHCGPEIDARCLNLPQDAREAVWAPLVAQEIEMALQRAKTRHEVIIREGA